MVTMAVIGSPRPARPQLERVRVRIAVGPQLCWETPSESGAGASEHPTARGPGGPLHSAYSRRTGSGSARDNDLYSLVTEPPGLGTVTR
jgi:hypothetical protein